MKTNWIHIAAPLILIVLIAIPALWRIGADENTRTNDMYLPQNQTDIFEQISLQAKAAYVYDTRDGNVLYSKNGELQFPLASLTKIMTALVAAEGVSANSTLSINKRILLPEGDSGFRVGEKWSIKNMIDMTLVASSNDGARALASIGSFPDSDGDADANTQMRFVEMMNKKARELGLAQTYFLNESGLDENISASGAYGSARDIAALLSYVIHTHPDLMDATVYRSISVSSSDAVHTVYNTNKALDKIPGIIASKTGFTDLAGGNLAIAFEAGPLRSIIIVVLGSTEEGRFDDVAVLVNAAIAAVAKSK